MANSDIVLSEMRLSLFWIRTFSNMFLRESESKRNRAKLDFLGRQVDYAQHFQSLGNAPSSADLSMPWNQSAGQPDHFWQYYLGNPNPQAISGEEAWEYIVPLRTTIPATVQSHSGSRPFALEGYYFPHGVAFMATAYLDQERPFSEMIDWTLDVRNPGNRFEMIWRTGEKNRRGLKVTLEEIIQLCLDYLQRGMLRNAEPIGFPAEHSFRVATAIRGHGVDPSQAPDESVRLALQALCLWNKNWSKAKLSDPNQFEIPTHLPEKGDLMYGYQHSRAIWFPRLFTAKEGASKLGYYHRHLTMLSLQTASLIALARLATKYILYEDVMPAALEDLARRAAGLLGRLYGGSDDTFKSWSAFHQIQDHRIQDIDDRNRQVDVVNQLREFFGLTPLTPQARK